MIDCDNCILKNARMSDLKCEVSCLELEDALREHDKQIRAEVIGEFVAECEKMKCWINTSNTPMNFIYEAAKHLK